MGQRSQIFVRYQETDGTRKLVARYYGWNYGERMISRARHHLMQLIPWTLFTTTQNLS